MDYIKIHDAANKIASILVEDEATIADINSLFMQMSIGKFFCKK